jgi:ABC-2 type transport system permease protein
MIRKAQNNSICLFNQMIVEFKLFWRSHEAVYLTFLVPMLGMILLVYLSKEGVLERFFIFLIQGLGGTYISEEMSPVAFLTASLVTYCVIAAAFENLTPELVRQREEGILKRLGGTPLRKWNFLISKTLNASLLVFVEILLIFAIGLLSEEITVVGSWWLLGVILLLGTFTFSAMGFVVSSLVKSTDAAIMAVHAVYIPMLLLCGVLIPIETFPRILRTAAAVLPVTHFIDPFRSIMIEGTGLAANGWDFLILLGWLGCFWLIGIRVFRWEP